MSKSKKVNWHILTGNTINCNIDKQAKLHGCYNLTNVIIGKGTYVASNANISNTQIGKFCSIGPNLICGWGIHPIRGISTSPVFYSIRNQAGFTYSKDNKIKETEPIRIGNDVFIGVNVTILDGVKIGDGAIIGAGAVVSKDIPPYSIAIGCPIKILKYRFSEEHIISLLKSKWWDQDEEVLKMVEESFFDVENFITTSKRSQT